MRKLSQIARPASLGLLILFLIGLNCSGLCAEADEFIGVSWIPADSSEESLQEVKWQEKNGPRGTPGDIISAAIRCIPQKAVQGAVVRVADLSGPDGAIIPGKAVKLFRVRYRGAIAKKGQPIVIAPEFLMPLDGKLDIPGGEMVYLWMTIPIPADAQPGIYKGAFRITASDRQISRPLQVKVLPFKLVKPDVVFSMLYTTEFRMLDRFEPDFEPARKRFGKERKEAFIAKGTRVIRDLAAHGMNTVFPHADRYWNERDGVLVFPDLETSLGTARKAGMTATPGWMVSWFTHAQWADLEKFDEERDTARLRRLAARGLEIAKAQGFERIILVPADEPDHPRKRPVARKLLEAVKDIRDVDWAVTGKPDTLRDLAGLYQIAIVAGGTPEDWADLKTKADQLWLYDNNATTGRSPTWSRFVYGLFGWRVGFDGVTSWTYPPHVENFKNARIDARDKSKIPTFTAEGEPVNTIVWEAIREGICDRRYIATLETEIERVRATPQAELAEQAAAMLAELHSRIEPSLAKHGWEHTEYGSPRPLGFEWNDLIKVRALLTKTILRLRKIPSE